MPCNAITIYPSGIIIAIIPSKIIPPPIPSMAEIDDVINEAIKRRKKSMMYYFFNLLFYVFSQS